jgi:hypothetical protein
MLASSPACKVNHTAPRREKTFRIGAVGLCSSDAALSGTEHSMWTVRGELRRSMTRSGKNSRLSVAEQRGKSQDIRNDLIRLPTLPRRRSPHRHPARERNRPEPRRHGAQWRNQAPQLLLRGSPPQRRKAMSKVWCRPQSDQTYCSIMAALVNHAK